MISLDYLYEENAPFCCPLHTAADEQVNKLLGRTTHALHLPGCSCPRRIMTVTTTRTSKNQSTLSMKAKQGDGEPRGLGWKERVVSIGCSFNITNAPLKYYFCLQSSCIPREAPQVFRAHCWPTTLRVFIWVFCRIIRRLKPGKSADSSPENPQIHAWKIHR
jgi:hypothetical protein